MTVKSLLESFRTDIRVIKVETNESKDVTVLNSLEELYVLYGNCTVSAWQVYSELATYIIIRFENIRLVLQLQL